VKTATPQLKTHLRTILRAIEEKKGTQTTILDAQDSPLLIDHIIITSADNPKQIRAIVNNIREKMDTEPYGYEGGEVINWFVLDYGDTIIHVFDEATRAFYDLEGLYGEVIYETDDS